MEQKDIFGPGGALNDSPISWKETLKSIGTEWNPSGN